MHHGRRFRAGILAALCYGSVAMTGSRVAADSTCKPVHGKFTIQIVTGPDCLSSAGLCGIGTYKGGIAGPSTFTATSIVPTVDTPLTAVIAITGDATIETRDGSLLTQDAFMLHTTGNGEFAELDTIVGGTGAWAGASGVLQAVGTSTPTSVEGQYFGEICTP